MESVKFYSDRLSKSLEVKVDEFGRVEVSYKDGSDSGVASFAPDSKRVDKYVEELKKMIFDGVETFDLKF